MGRGGQVWSAGSREYQVFGRTLAGDTTVAFSRSHVPFEVPVADRDSLSNAWTPEYDVSAAIPDTEEALWRIIEDDAGRIFVFPNIAGVEKGTVADAFAEGVCPLVNGPSYERSVRGGAMTKLPPLSGSRGGR